MTSSVSGAPRCSAGCRPDWKRCQTMDTSQLQSFPGSMLANMYTKGRPLAPLHLLFSTTLPPRLTRIAHAPFSRNRWHDGSQAGRIFSSLLSLTPSARAFARWTSTQLHASMPAQREVGVRRKLCRC